MERDTDIERERKKERENKDAMNMLQSLQETRWHTIRITIRITKIKSAFCELQIQRKYASVPLNKELTSKISGGQEARCYTVQSSQASLLVLFI